MSQDIRKSLKTFEETDVELSVNHRPKFEELLYGEFASKKIKKNHFKRWSVAASVLLIVSLTIQFNVSKTEKPKDATQKIEITLGSISPEFNTIETYYVNSMNLEISKLDIKESDDDLLEGYLEKLSELTKEYRTLTKELNTNGVNDSTIDALISNLQLRLQLLKRLKKQLKQIKNLNQKQDELQIS